MPIALTETVRIVTAASLFDGHDAAINIMRRILQAKGAEIIHLGHNRSVQDIVEAAIEEDAHAIAITSYQGGHLEFFKYMKELLEEQGCGHIRIFGGGGGTILPDEIKTLHDYGITRIYSPDDGREMGLEGMIEDLLHRCRTNGDHDKSQWFQAPAHWNKPLPLSETSDIRKVARAISLSELGFHQQSASLMWQKEPELLWKLWHALNHNTSGLSFRRQWCNNPWGVEFICDRKACIIKPQSAQETGQPFVIEKLTDQVFAAAVQLQILSLHQESAVSALIQAINHLSDSDGQQVYRYFGGKGLVLGITGTGGAGKSSVTDELVRRFLHHYPSKTVAVVSVDPSKKKSGGALLGDRIRMNSISHPRVYMRSMATREDNRALSHHVRDALDVCRQAGYDLIILESAGTGQSDTSVLDFCQVSLYVMTPEYGAPSQLEKINMLDYAHVIAVNKADKSGAHDALADVRKQYKRNYSLWSAEPEDLPVFATMASKFNDEGTNRMFAKLLELMAQSWGMEAVPLQVLPSAQLSRPVIPPSRSRYLSEIADTVRQYDQWVNQQASVATRLYQLNGVLECEGAQNLSPLHELKDHFEQKLDRNARQLLDQWPEVKRQYEQDYLEYDVRGKTIRQPLTTTSLSGTRIRKVALPAFSDWGDLLKWQLQENLPGSFPYTAGVFNLKRQGEDPTRMFAGEGSPERTNRRFHYVSAGQPAKRLSTAFDSVTLYGEDPAYRPDIYGKIGNSGVSIATLDDAKKLYSGFDLCHAATSVSMTINGPAPIMLAFFLNTAIDQQCEKKIDELGLWDKVEALKKARYKNQPVPQYHGYGDLPEGNTGLGLRLLGLSGSDVLPAEVYNACRAEALQQVRGTVQADILKEDQAQNTCIFSTEFALTLMGDVQQYFIDHSIRNFYSVSISGYHIAEAGANPITQLAFTLANGFTFVENYLSRGMHIDEFAPNLSFFFSNGMDPEYSVIGRVARRIWAKAMRYKYKANERSQKLKYHIQTSGRSLHAQEIDFNDIRTTLQALYAIYDNCNSLHTNAFDEAITTPTEASVRRAMAIQLIINKELGTVKTENFLQGAFMLEELTNLVEEAVLAEFNRITERGGVLGAMERMYQRNKIQEESLHYEMQKHSGALPVIGVNTFLNSQGSPTEIPGEVIRSTTEEKERQIINLQAFLKRNETVSGAALQRLKETAVRQGNLFEELMECVKCCSLGQITHALYEVGGQYRRNM